MAIVRPDTSATPIWRRKPTYLEHPIKAWRIWNVEGIIRTGHVYVQRPGTSTSRNVLVKDVYLSSVAANCKWEGPVIQAHKRPVDPQYWDKLKNLRSSDSSAYYHEQGDTMQLAGIHAVKTREQAIELLEDYNATCYGEVDLWGRVAQFELGYRAETAMVRSLFLSQIGMWLKINTRNDHRQYEAFCAEVIPQTIKQLSARYGCEVTIE